jgi:maltose-binding protein MalE
MKKKIIIAIVVVVVLIAGSVLVWDYNNPVAEIDMMQHGGYDTPMFVTLTQNRFIQNETISQKAHEFNESVEADYLAFLENYEQPYNVKVNVVEEDGKLIVTYFGTATQNGKEVEYLEQRTYDIDFATEIRGSVDLPTK